MSKTAHTDPSTLPERLRERDTTPRARKQLNEFVFAGSYGRSATLKGRFP